MKKNRQNLVSAMLLLSGLSTGYLQAAPHKVVTKMYSTQQDNTCVGQVLDQKGETVIGASVIVKGTSNGTITDFDGNFTLNEVKTGDMIEISYVGYQTQVVQYDGKTLKITLKENTELLDEVVVVGYGVQKKRDLTGAISSVKMDETPVNTYSTVSHALAGKAAGLQVTQSSAQVGGGSLSLIHI